VGKNHQKLICKVTDVRGSRRSFGVRSEGVSYKIPCPVTGTCCDRLDWDVAQVACGVNPACGDRERHLGSPCRARAAFPCQAPVPTECTVLRARLDLSSTPPPARPRPPAGSRRPPAGPPRTSRATALTAGLPLSTCAPARTRRSCSCSSRPVVAIWDDGHARAPHPLMRLLSAGPPHSGVCALDVCIHNTGGSRLV
jgi:hypothetical protein